MKHQSKVYSNKKHSFDTVFHFLEENQFMNRKVQLQ